MKKVPENSKAPIQLHYGWIIVITGVEILFACLGLGRFSIGMLLHNDPASKGLAPLGKNLRDHAGKPETPGSRVLLNAL